MTPEQINQWRHRIRVHTYANYHYEMARALIGKAETAAAHQHLRKALEIMPDHILSSLLLVDSLGREGLEAEILVVRQAARAATGLFDTAERLRAGMQALTASQPQPVPSIPSDTLPEAAAALETMHEVAALLRQQEPTHRRQSAEIAVDLFVDAVQWGELFAKALPAYLGAGRWADTIRLGTISVAIAPGNPRVEHALALAFLATRDIDQAQAILEPALITSPFVPFLSADRAMVQAHKGDGPAAIAAAREAVMTGAEKPISYSLLAWNGILFADDDALTEALPALRSRKPGDISPWSELPLALAALLRGDEAEAEALLRGLFAQSKFQAPTRLCFAVLPGEEQRERLLPRMLAAGYDPVFPPLLPVA